MSWRGHPLRQAPELVEVPSLNFQRVDMQVRNEDVARLHAGPISRIRISGCVSAWNIDPPSGVTGKILLAKRAGHTFALRIDPGLH